MKKAKMSALLCAALFTGISFISCSDDDDSGSMNEDQKTIAEIAIENDQTDSLVVALTRADLVETFQNAGNFTVFAPTNEAFKSFLSDNGFSSIGDIPVTALTEVLQYHVLGTEVKAADLNDDLYGTTINTSSPDKDATLIEIDVTGGVKLNNNASVVAADVDASNGVIHLIDKVITTKNVVEMAINDERFSLLVEALTAYNFGYTTTLSGTGPFTVFAPTNAAFEDLLATNPNWNSVSDIDSTTLGSVLTYHVVNGLNVQSSELSQDQKIATLNGGSLDVDLRNGAELITANAAQSAVKVIVTDVQGNNGVIHAVDKVLLP